MSPLATVGRSAASSAGPWRSGQARLGTFLVIARGAAGAGVVTGDLPVLVTEVKARDGWYCCAGGAGEAEREGQDKNGGKQEVGELHGGRWGRRQSTLEGPGSGRPDSRMKRVLTPPRAASG